jgi:hypothetical protein
MIFAEQMSLIVIREAKAARLPPFKLFHRGRDQGPGNKELNDRGEAAFFFSEISFLGSLKQLAF